MFCLLICVLEIRIDLYSFISFLIHIHIIDSTVPTVRTSSTVVTMISLSIIYRVTLTGYEPSAAKIPSKIDFG